MTEQQTAESIKRGMAEELRTAAENTRAGFAPMHPALFEVTGEVLDEVFDRLTEDLYVDTPECPNCGEGCGGHADELLCDSCGNWWAPGDEDSCACYTKVLALARAINQFAEQGKRVQAAAEALVDEQTMLKEMSVRDGKLTLEAIPPHEIVAAFVDVARDMLATAPNYSETQIVMPGEDPKVALDFTKAGDPEIYVFTVQRKGKTTPHQARLAAEAERDRLAKQVQQLRAELEAAHANGGQ
ncbi:hypothetical protein AB0C10_16185 [Microbispora amethystogenes]|uniref:hypothetical protein n=1 Tax=Microbispora amethystogenes TaxID=1427754 RepID=UPI00340B1269